MDAWVVKSDREEKMYRWDRQVLCSKIAPWQNSSPGLQNSSPEFQNSPIDIETKGSFLAFRGTILQSRGAILPGGYFAALNLTVQMIFYSVPICVLYVRLKNNPNPSITVSILAG